MCDWASNLHRKAKNLPLPIVFLNSFESGNGIVRNEQGELKEVLDEENKPRSVVIVRGSYSYPNEDGKLETVNYFADETGYHAEGDSIPKSASR